MFLHMLLKLLRDVFLCCVLIGGSNDECKPGGVMVEFDDGDRGWISLRNIRLLPPGYQIHCGFLIYISLFVEMTFIK